MINSTLIVQIINFWIAYFVLKKILLVPALKLIKKREEKRIKVLGAISLLSHEIDQKTESKNINWIACVDKLKKNKPNVIVTLAKVAPIEMKQKLFDAESIKKSGLIDKIKDRMVHDLRKNS